MIWLKEWVDVVSSNLEEVEYNNKTKELKIKFKNSPNIYIFKNVPGKIYAGMMWSNSKGKYFHKNIKNKYQYRIMKKNNLKEEYDSNHPFAKTNKTYTDLNLAKADAKEMSHEGYVQHVNEQGDGSYIISDWYDDESTVASYEGGIQINESTLTESEVVKTLIITNPGIIQTTKGEARSGEARKGDIFKVTRENEYYYFGMLIPQAGMGFVHSSGLSGRRDIDSTKQVDTSNLEFAISKKYVDTNKEDDFWASAESKDVLQEKINRLEEITGKKIRLVENTEDILQENGIGFDVIVDTIYNELKNDPEWEEKAIRALEEYGIGTDDQIDILNMLHGEDYFDDREIELEGEEIEKKVIKYSDSQYGELDIVLDQNREIDRVINMWDSSLSKEELKNLDIRLYNRILACVKSNNKNILSEEFNNEEPIHQLSNPYPVGTAIMGEGKVDSKFILKVNKTKDRVVRHLKDLGIGLRTVDVLEGVMTALRREFGYLNGPQLDEIKKIVNSGIVTEETTTAGIAVVGVRAGEKSKGDTMKVTQKYWGGLVEKLEKLTGQKVVLKESEASYQIQQLLDKGKTVKYNNDLYLKKNIKSNKNSIGLYTYKDNQLCEKSEDLEWLLDWARMNWGRIKIKGNETLTGQKVALKEGEEYNYMMLDRLKSDCDYFLGHGNRSEKVLHQGSIDGQIKEMKRIWNNLSVKPEWLSLKDIEKYEAKMKEETLTEKVTGVSEDLGETGLMVIGRTPIDNTDIGQALESSDLYATWNPREGYWFFPEDEENYDELELEIQNLLDQNNINARIGGIFNEK